MLLPCLPISTGVQLSHRSNHVLGRVRALDYSDEQNKHDPSKGVCIPALQVLVTQSTLFQRVVISTERVATRHRLSGTALVCANIPAVVIKIASFSSQMCPHFGHPICKSHVQKVI